MNQRVDIRSVSAAPFDAGRDAPASDLLAGLAARLAEARDADAAFAVVHGLLADAGLAGVTIELAGAEGEAAMHRWSALPEIGRAHV